MDTKIPEEFREATALKGNLHPQETEGLHNHKADFSIGSESSLLEVWKDCQQDLCQSPLHSDDMAATAPVITPTFKAVRMREGLC